MAEKCLLFVFEPLQPKHFKTPRTTVQIWPDRILGLLCQIGDQTVLRKAGQTESGWIEGHVLEIDTDELHEIDAYEDIESGEVRRVAVETASGHVVWVYEYCGEQAAPLVQ